MLLAVGLRRDGQVKRPECVDPLGGEARPTGSMRCRKFDHRGSVVLDPGSRAAAWSAAWVMTGDGASMRRAYLVAGTLWAAAGRRASKRPSDGLGEHRGKRSGEPSGLREFEVAISRRRLVNPEKRPSTKLVLVSSTAL